MVGWHFKIAMCAKHNLEIDDLANDATGSEVPPTCVTDAANEQEKQYHAAQAPYIAEAKPHYRACRLLHTITRTKWSITGIPRYFETHDRKWPRRSITFNIQRLIRCKHAWSRITTTIFQRNIQPRIHTRSPTRVQSTKIKVRSANRYRTKANFIYVSPSTAWHRNRYPYEDEKDSLDANVVSAKRFQKFRFVRDYQIGTDNQHFNFMNGETSSFLSGTGQWPVESLRRQWTIESQIRKTSKLSDMRFIASFGLSYKR